MADADDNDDESGYGPFRTENLKQQLKDQTPEMYNGEEMWASSDGMAELENQLLEIARYAWIEAAEETESNGRRIVKSDEISSAFDNLLEPHNLLTEAANDMMDLHWRFVDTANKSPAINIETEQERDE
jgi:hypothetical protein